MKKEKEHIFLASPHMSEEGYEKYYIEDAFEKNFIAPLGENVIEFERELGAKIGARTGAALSSGTAGTSSAEAANRSASSGTSNAFTHDVNPLCQT